MKRWRSGEPGVMGSEIESAKIDAFLEEIWSVCVKHAMALSHEDQHGAFLVVSIEDGNREWLMDAHDETRAQRKEP